MTMTAKELKDLRKKLNLTQHDFGLMLGFSQPQIRISELERGTMKISERIKLKCDEIKRQYSDKPFKTEAIVKNVESRDELMNALKTIMNNAWVSEPYEIETIRYADDIIAHVDDSDVFHINFKLMQNAKKELDTLL